MKKSVFAAVLLSMSVALFAGCSEETKETVSITSESAVSQKADSNTSDNGGEASEETVASNDRDTQFKLFSDKSDVWFHDGEDFSYTVTDLDRDGNLEIIAAICEGSGGFTRAYFYEASDDRKVVTELGKNFSEGEDMTDIITDEALKFYVQDDIVYYACDNYTYGGRESSVYKVIFYIDTNVVDQLWLIGDITEDDEHTYYDFDSMETRTKEQFDGCVDAYFPEDIETGTIKLYWTSGSNYDFILNELNANCQ